MYNSKPVKWEGINDNVSNIFYSLLFYKWLTMYYINIELQKNHCICIISNTNN